MSRLSLSNVPSCVCSLFYRPVVVTFLMKCVKTTFRQYINDVTAGTLRAFMKYMLVHSAKCGAPEKLTR